MRREKRRDDFVNREKRILLVAFSRKTVTFRGRALLALDNPIMAARQVAGLPGAISRSWGSDVVAVVPATRRQAKLHGSIMQFFTA